MTERTNTPPSQPPSEQEIKEFQEKFGEFFENLPEREKLEAASIGVTCRAGGRDYRGRASRRESGGRAIK